MVCHSGVRLTPEVEGKVHHFSAGGLYNGLVLLVDDETNSYWDHITGEAVHGALAGKATLEIDSLETTTVAAELARSPDTQVLVGELGLIGTLASKVQASSVRGKGVLPPGFRKTMGEMDERLPYGETGLGVVVGEVARFFPSARLESSGWTGDMAGRRLHVRLREDRVPFATWVDDGTRPFQLFTRWYGFSFTYPGCEIAESTQSQT